MNAGGRDGLHDATKKRWRWGPVAGIIVALLLLAAACGGDEDQPGGGVADAPDDAVEQVDDDVEDPEDQAFDQAERIDVFKLATDIPQGTPGEVAIENGYITRAEIPREFLPANATSNLEAIEGKVALNDLSTNQVVVDGMFVDPSSAPGATTAPSSSATGSSTG